MDQEQIIRLTREAGYPAAVVAEVRRGLELGLSGQPQNEPCGWPVAHPDGTGECILCGWQHARRGPNAVEEAAKVRETTVHVRTR